MNTGVLLYGPPAVGKDTVTRELSAQGPFAHFHRLKCGPGRTTGYRMISRSQLDRVQQPDRIYTNERYGATYIVDRPGLLSLWQAGLVPVVHLGQPEAVTAVTKGTPDARWLVVDLHCPPSVLTARIRARQTGDDNARLNAAQSTSRLTRADLSIDTGETTPDQAARLITESLSAAQV